MVLETLALLSGVKGLFMYNRQSYSFNKTLDQERLYHLQKMRIEQIKLFRDDIRDLFELVVGKMDNYYLINTLALGFSLAFYYEGKIPSDVPSWLFWLWAMSLGSTIVCLFLSVWFAVHASVVAQMFSTRLLTQWLRLPVPGPEQIDAGAPRLEEFESVSVKDQLRVPVISKPSSGQGEKLDPPTTQDPLIQEGYNYYMGHFFMFVRLQKHWMNLDAYCRIFMVLGCNQILNAVTYTGLAYFSLFDYQWGTLAFVVVPIVFACIHVHINLLLTKKEAVLFLLVHSLAPILGGVAAGVQMMYTVSGNGDKGAILGQAIALGSYFCHLLSSLGLIYLGLELHNGLPTRFAAVNYIDVLGLQKVEEESDLSKPKFSGRLSALFSRASSAESAEKAQPRIDQVVPPAASIRRSEKMYQSLVQKKVATGSGRLNRSSSAPNVGEGKSVQFEDEGTDRVFATQLPPQRGSLRILNDMLETTGLPRKSSTVLIGPQDYAPTVAQLHAPDVLGRMPQVAFKSLGVTMVSLWALGIVFGSISLSGVVDIGWVNVVVASSDPTVSAEEMDVRRLSEIGYLEAPAKFLKVDAVECGSGGSIRIRDGTTDRAFIWESGREWEPVSKKAEEGGMGITSPVVLEASDRSYLIRVEGHKTVEVTVPPDHSLLPQDPRFFVDRRNGRVISQDLEGGIIAWCSRTGKYFGNLDVHCTQTGTVSRLVGVCDTPEGSRLVFHRGDSCLL